MTLTLYLLRHAEAESHSLQKDDIDRALAERGVKDALRLGEQLAEDFSVNAAQASVQTGFDYIWCSNAVRTRQTLEYVKQGMATQGRECSGAVQYENKLYHATAVKMMNVLHLTPPQAHKVLMVGHNPGISELAAILANSGDEKLIRDVQLSYPTCALAIYKFSSKSWQEISANDGEITAFIVPQKVH